MPDDKLTQLARILVDQVPELYGVQLEFMLRVEDPKDRYKWVVDPEPKWSIEIRGDYHSIVVPRSTGKTAEEALLNAIRAIATRRKEWNASRRKQLEDSLKSLEDASTHVARAEAVMERG